MKRPFELNAEELAASLEAMVDATVGDLGSAFLLLPRGPGFIEYADFRQAYEVLKRHTRGFEDLTVAAVLAALSEDSRAFGVLRAIAGISPPEWADLAREALGAEVPQGAARNIDRECRLNPGYYARLAARQPVSFQRVQDLVEVAVAALVTGPTPHPPSMLHRLEQVDTRHGLDSLRYAAAEGVPHAVLLYERYLGRPFASHRDAVSELVGEVMENAIEERLRQAGISYRKTKRAARIPGFDQAPDFCVPDEHAPAVVIEAKITSDDGTARDKVARIKVLASQREKHLRQGWRPYEVVACIDGRGFRERREDMRQMLTALGGKVFTTATLDALILNTRLAGFVSARPA